MQRNNSEEVLQLLLLVSTLSSFSSIIVCRTKAKRSDGRTFSRCSMQLAVGGGEQQFLGISVVGEHRTPTKNKEHKQLDIYITKSGSGSVIIMALHDLFDSDSDSDSFDNERVEGVDNERLEEGPVAAAGNGGGDSDNNSEASIDEDEEDCIFDLQQISDDATELVGKGDYACIQNITDDGWEKLGRDISYNAHLETLCLYGGALNDRKMSFLFRGLTSNSGFTRGTYIEEMHLNENGLSAAGVRSMVPFLQNANYLRELSLDDNNIQSEGFNVLFRALSNSPLEELNCRECRIESIDIDSERLPTNLTSLDLEKNTINTDGCRGLAKLLQGGDSTLTKLFSVTTRLTTTVWKFWSMPYKGIHH